MKEKSLKSGNEIVNDFIHSLRDRDEMDRDSFQAIRDLHEAGTLTKVRLLNLLKENRKGIENGETKKTGN